MAKKVSYSIRFTVCANLADSFQAEGQLSETPKRAEIDAIMNHARKLVLTR